MWRDQFCPVLNILIVSKPTKPKVGAKERQTRFFFFFFPNKRLPIIILLVNCEIELMRISYEIGFIFCGNGNNLSHGRVVNGLSY